MRAYLDAAADRWYHLSVVHHGGKEDTAVNKMLGGLLLAGIFLLLLSALVVTPESSLPAAAELPADVHAVFMPAALPAAADAAGQLLRQPDWRVLLGVLFAPALLLLPAPATRDANGRIITAVRYENSVYQLFRPEVAGG